MRYALFNVVLLIMLFGCTRVGPIEVYQPITKERYALVDIENAIEYAAKQRGWKVIDKREGIYTLVYYSPYYELNVEIRYSSDGYTISYSHLDELSKKKESFSQKNKKIKILQKSIRKRLVAIQRAYKTIKRRKAQKSSIELELEELKRLYDKGLIDKDEYKAKKAKILKLG